jgi:phosphoglycolate phosphatase
VKSTIFLFDVDGTLCRTGGAGGRAMRRAFHELHGRADAMDVVDVRGNTDPNIVAEALRAIPLEPTEDAYARLMERYLAHLEDELERAQEYVTMPGVMALLDALAHEQHALGLGTGNVEAGARAKLRRGGMDTRFGFGGFGSDAADRAELIRKGAQRGAERLGRALDDCRVIVIGDTPRDVLAAQAIGAESVAVATGGHPIEDFDGLGATLTVPTLEHPDVYRLLGVDKHQAR